jgi:hypothetical protein
MNGAGVAHGDCIASHRMISCDGEQQNRLFLFPLGVVFASSFLPSSDANNPICLLAYLVERAVPLVILWPLARKYEWSRRRDPNFGTNTYRAPGWCTSSGDGSFWLIFLCPGRLEACSTADLSLRME